MYRVLGRGKDEQELKPKLEGLEHWAAQVGIGALPVLATLREHIATFAHD
jgi:hypothetical protein